jgi:peptide/nickel transport system substrate-binding protein
VIARTPSSDVATLSRDPKLAIVSTGTIYVFNLEFDFREKPPQVTAKDGSPLAKNPFLDARVREAFDLAIDREALAEFATEGQAKPASQLVTPNIFGYNPGIAATKPDVKRAKQLLAEAGYPDGFKVTLSFTSDRLPGDREVGTTLAQMLAQIGIAVAANAQPTALFFPARQRGEYSLAMWGWATSTGEAHYTLSSLTHTFDAAKGADNYNVVGYSNPALDGLIDGAAVALDEGKRRGLLQEALALTARDRPRLPLVVIGTAWAAQKAKVTVTPRVDEDTLAMNIKPAGGR